MGLQGHAIWVSNFSAPCCSSMSRLTAWGLDNSETTTTSTTSFKRRCKAALNGNETDCPLQLVFTFTLLFSCSKAIAISLQEHDLLCIDEIVGRRCVWSQAKPTPPAPFPSTPPAFASCDAAGRFITVIGRCTANLISIAHQRARAYIRGAGCQAAGSTVTWIAYLVARRRVWHKSIRAVVGCTRA